MRLNIERQNKLETTRIEHAKKKIEALGYNVEVIGKGLTFIFNESRITFWAYSGWHTGKGINDGRGLTKLLKQIRSK